MPLKLMYITNRADIALIAENAGVDRIWIDLETLGKRERQANVNSVKSDHKIEDIKMIKPLLTKAKMLVRVNPVNRDSQNEINQVIDAGAEIVMLPMWKTTTEVELFIKFVNKRAKVCLLLETREAVVSLDDSLSIKGIDEIHIGLNDLHLSYRLTFLFELLTNGIIEKICCKIKRKGIPYGFGGIAQLDGGMLPARNIIAEHYRLGSSMAILSRSFCDLSSESDLSKIQSIFNDGIKKIREYEQELETKPTEFFIQNQFKVKALTEDIVNRILKKRAYIEENIGL
jgi:2-keto-3-deoxy-L-rhamnonate aldolase RhmA